MLACQWAERCHSVPSPHVGEGQGEGYNKQRPVSPIRDSITALSISRTCTGFASHRVLCRHPSPCPSPTWGSSMHTSRDMLTHRGFLDCAGALPCDSMRADHNFGGRRWSLISVSAALETSG